MRRPCVEFHLPAQPDMDCRAAGTASAVAMPRQLRSAACSPPGGGGASSSGGRGCSESGAGAGGGAQPEAVAAAEAAPAEQAGGSGGRQRQRRASRAGGRRAGAELLGMACDVWCGPPARVGSNVDVAYTLLLSTVGT